MWMMGQGVLCATLKMTATDTPEGCDALQRYLDKLEKWTDWNLKKFNEK